MVEGVFQGDAILMQVPLQMLYCLLQYLREEGLYNETIPHHV